VEGVRVSVSGGSRTIFKWICGCRTADAAGRQPGHVL